MRINRLSKLCYTDDIHHEYYVTIPDDTAFTVSQLQPQHQPPEGKTCTNTQHVTVRLARLMVEEVRATVQMHTSLLFITSHIIIALLNCETTHHRFSSYRAGLTGAAHWIWLIMRQTPPNPTLCLSCPRSTAALTTNLLHTSPAGNVKT